MSFVSDLEKGKEVEELTIKHLTRLGKHPIPWPWPVKITKHPPDILLPSRKALEVKHDIMSAKTGNLFFEERALTQVDADYLFVYCPHDKDIHVFKLKYLIDELKLWASGGKARAIGNAGDGKKKGRKTNPGWVVPVKDVKQMKSYSKKSPVDKKWREDYGHYCTNQKL